MTKKVYTSPETERGDRLYDLSALTKIAPMFQIEDCCYVVLEKDGEEVRRLFRVDSTTLLPRVILGTYARWRFAYQAYVSHSFVGRIRR
ncbi:protein of unknown function [Citrobacter freundii]|nr:protein of unknown function [Citrobacter freundii]